MRLYIFFLLYFIPDQKYLAANAYFDNITCYLYILNEKSFCSKTYLNVCLLCVFKQ